MWYRFTRNNRFLGLCGYGGCSWRRQGFATFESPSWRTILASANTSCCYFSLDLVVVVRGNAIVARVVALRSYGRFKSVINGGSFCIIGGFYVEFVVCCIR